MYIILVTKLFISKVFQIFLRKWGERGVVYTECAGEDAGQWRIWIENVNSVLIHADNQTKKFIMSASSNYEIIIQRTFFKPINHHNHQ